MSSNRMASPMLAGYITYAVKDLGVKIEDIQNPSKGELVDVALAMHKSNGWTIQGLEVIVNKGRIDINSAISQSFAQDRIRFAQEYGKNPSSDEVMRALYESFYKG